MTGLLSVPVEDCSFFSGDIQFNVIFFNQNYILKGVNLGNFHISCMAVIQQVIWKKNLKPFQQ